MDIYFALPDSFLFVSCLLALKLLEHVLQLFDIVHIELVSIKLIRSYRGQSSRGHSYRSCDR